MLKYIVFLLLFFEKIIIEILKVFMRISLSVYIADFDKGKRIPWFNYILQSGIFFLKKT